ncbi:MAG TPA: hypothetical protein PKE64_30195 [Anaerolineae bacterium]|nr:hypothetical protein [Anaerolineae bacterium]HMR68303.1 hypothetical protein [Anaerolineae bacterium]
MKKFIVVVSVTFFAVLAAVVGFRLSPDAMAVIIGIICGVLASVPTSIILVWVLRQRDRQTEVEMNSTRFGHYPPVVVVNGQGPNGYPGAVAPPPALLPTTPPGMRDFKVIGQENTEAVGDFLPSIWE